jgi:DNA-binding MarR family transcriptional regulator
MRERGDVKAAKTAKAISARRRKVDYGVLPELVGYHLRKAQVATFQDFARSMQGSDIRPGQFGVLVLIDANPGLNQSELGEAMGVDRSTVVAVIDRLQERGLVARRPVPNDRRSYALELTLSGRNLLAQLRPQVAAHEARLAEGLNPSEQIQLIDLLRRLAANLGMP